jgi:hypothetical protein
MKRGVPAAAVLAALCLGAAATSLAQPPASRPGDGWVVLSVGEYRALRDKAYPPPPLVEPPPVAAALGRVEYDLAVDGSAASGQVRLIADVFKDGWVAIPIPAGLRVGEARLDGHQVALVTDRSGGIDGLAVLLSRAGRNVITLDVTIPVASKAGSESFVLPVSSAPVQRAVVTIRVADASLAATGGLVEQRTGLPSPAATRFVVCGRPGEALTLAWARRAAVPAAARPLRWRGSVTELAQLGEDAAQLSAQVGVEVVEGAAERVSLRLPPGFVMGQISGPLVADWDLRGDTALTVSLLEPLERSTTFTITGEVRSAREGKLSVPLVRLADAERETGGVAVEVLGAGEIKEHATRGLDAADATDLSEAIAARQSPALVAFRFRSLPSAAERSLDVTVARYTPQAVLLANVDEAWYRALLTEDGKTLVEARYAVRNSQRSFLATMLPATATLWTASVDGRPVRPGRTPEGALLLPLLGARGEAGSSVVRVLYIVRGAAWSNQGTVTVDLPVVDLPVSRTGLEVRHSPRYRLTLEPGAFREQPDAAPESALLRGEATGPRAAPARTASKDDRTSQELRDLVTVYQRNARAGTIAGLLPVTIPFPAMGPSRLLAAELTSEGKLQQVRFTFKREGN